MPKMTSALSQEMAELARDGRAARAERERMGLVERALALRLVATGAASSSASSRSSA